ncbi:MAG: glycine zipper 2TM domain-containing protein [Betaproteobacteria bacterium]|nr:glycine zipper 2TM domain-containing protein [Betaproteobacteria bacterium]MBI2508575.1 glycine zipper 2TM domain-containing protein [Betaproteobacteria bacterium]
METTNSVEKRSGMLYPMMLIAAIAVIVFSAAGIATMMGWMPSALSVDDPVAKAGAGRARAAASTAASCRDCGVIESIRAVQSQGEGSGLGAIGGAVVGGILGNQVGRGGGRTAATVVGAGAGAYAGHEIEKNVKKSVSYRIRVRMNDGTYRTFYEPAQPAYAVGQKVRVTGQGITAAG